MSHNSFGHLFRVTTWGESHGPAIGCVIDGCPPGLPLTEAEIQPFLDARRPGTSRHVTQRGEADQVRILSGTYEGRTTGTPISLLIENTDQRSADYAPLAATYRPGHADLAYEMKYGLRDPRGGGRSSARETACRVAAGAVARLVLGPAIRLRGAVAALGPHAADPSRWDWDAAATNPLWCPDPEALPLWEATLDALRREGNSIGATIALEATGVPPGLGAPIYGKLDADLAGALMGINAVKAVEIGAGWEAARRTGTENADEMRPAVGATAGPAGGEVEFLANHAGGILGGISTGQPILARFAVKPTSSIRSPLRTVTRAGEAAELGTTGRHDPCVGLRAVPVGEAMLACVLADQLLRHRGQCGPA